MCVTVQRPVVAQYSMKLSKYLALFSMSLAVACATTDPNAPDAPPGQTDAAPSDAAPNTPDATPLGADCDAILQDCGAGQKCALIVTNVVEQTGYPGCAVNGDKGLGEACTNPSAVDTADDCISGSHCVFGTCHAICGVSDTPCSEGLVCIGIGNLEMQFEICRPDCDPLSPTCAAGEGCYLISAGSGVCAPPVSPPGVGPHGACAAPNDCAPGSGCFDTPPDFECLVYCDYSVYPGTADPRCPGGEVCGPVEGEAVIGACN